MKILMAGDVVGSPGRKAFTQVAARLKAQGEADFIVVNAENSAAGRGLTGKLAEEIFAAGADVITMGDHTWDQKEFRAYLDTEKRVIRPANFAPGCHGKGFVTMNSAFGPVTVVNLIGRVFMNNYDCPYRTMDSILEQKASLGSVILVDMHAEATSEKIVMGRYLDGRVSCVVGTHTHVQTSDETVLPNGTAYITDLGMTGPKDSAIGRDLESVISMVTTGMPEPFKIARNDVVLEGIVADINPDSGKATGIRRIRERLNTDE